MNVDAILSQAEDLVRFRVAWWFKHFRKGSSIPVTTILLKIQECCTEAIKVKKISLDSWIPPSLDVLKFNVDGSARGSPGPAGMGGVLRDSYGKIMCVFSAFLGISDGISAEVEAIHKACSLCLSKYDLRNRSITIVSDSKTAVDWINEDNQDNLTIPILIQDIRFMLSILSNATVSFSSRVSNAFADMLAKKGSNREGDFVLWGDT